MQQRIANFRKQFVYIVISLALVICGWPAIASVCMYHLSNECPQQQLKSDERHSQRTGQWLEECNSPTFGHEDGH